MSATNLTDAERDFIAQRIEKHRFEGYSLGVCTVAAHSELQRLRKETAKQLAARKAAPAAKPTNLYSWGNFKKPATGRPYPLDACRLKAGSPLELKAAGVAATGAVTANVLARSGRAIEHPWWGRLIHDQAGREQLKDRLPLDYCHDSGQILGYAEDWRTEANNLVCVATLLPGESDRAREVIDLARRGVPYEASISFTPILIEELRPGKSATVNGQLIEGPASVIRRWRLTGLAVCPRGADSNTRTELK